MSTENTPATKTANAKDVAEYNAGIERMLQVVEIQTELGPVKLTPAIVRRYLAVGFADKITDQDITLFMALCKFNSLNPFLREAWLIKYGDVAQMVVSKDVLLKRAAEDPECENWRAGIIVWDPEKKAYFDTMGIIPPGNELLGGFCEIKMKNRPEFRLEVNLDEYMQYTRDGKVTQMWSAGQGKGKQATMIRKVALAQAIREVMPARAKRMYIPDELNLDPDKLPDGAIDISEIQKETSPPQPTNGTPKQQAEAEPQAESGLASRRRKNKFTGLNTELFPGGKIETCGVRPEQLTALKNFQKMPENKAVIVQFMEKYIGYVELSYLREEEALDLINLMKPVSAEPSAPPPQEEALPDGFGMEDPPELPKSEPPARKTMPPGAETKNGSAPLGRVFCRQQGKDVFRDFCMEECGMRKQDGFCPSLGEKPTASFMG